MMIHQPAGESARELMAATGATYRQLDRYAAMGWLGPEVKGLGQGNHRDWSTVTARRVRAVMLVVRLVGFDPVFIDPLERDGFVEMAVPHVGRIYLQLVNA